MKAITQDRYGPSAVLTLNDIELPAVAPGGVLVRVAAAGVDQGVWHLMAGRPYLVRLATGPRRPRQRVPGMDLAGTVAAVGRDVTAFKVGDRVFGNGEGTYAEYARAKPAKLAPMPRGLSFERAAAVPVSACTALDAVEDARIAAGHSVLVLGAAGGVGSYAVQLAAALGAEVTGVCRGEKTDFVRGLGAAHVLDYTREEPTGRFDAILDTGGQRSIPALRRLLKPKGTLVIIGGETDGKWFGGFGRSLRAQALSPFTGQRLRGLVSLVKGARLARVGELIESGAVTVPLDRVFPLAEAGAAIDHMRQGRVRGKVVVTV
ncbi:NADPH:quinone reductase [Actinorhabdospora filicis]|uniref:NADPH:quinone reductase n=1 Tax=Actinorhabdospora filicis TaxID=1785913 RepID=A0A9W6STD7_9ACTN|nr:NAD(P)-dependent alcohol dehydrogenase [Actinorhabdospora filicis]GLZ82002.1 NADPH:quinone reductase [Actinorhabdospora filicis]